MRGQRSAPAGGGRVFRGGLGLGVLCVLGVAGLFGVGLGPRGTEKLGYIWHWHRIPHYIFSYENGTLILGPLVHGLLVTLKITGVSLILAFIFGLTSALFRLSHSSIAGAPLAHTGHKSLCSCCSGAQLIRGCLCLRDLSRRHCLYSCRTMGGGLQPRFKHLSHLSIYTSSSGNQAYSAAPYQPGHITDQGLGPCQYDRYL